MVSNAFAIISDIHANLPALNAVFRDIEVLGIERIICLGDVIGYGPDPVSCVDRVRERCEVIVCGNHDEALIFGGIGFHQQARRAIEWTASQLKPGFFSGTKVRKRWDFVTQFKMSHRERNDLFVHGSPRDPTSEYILPRDAALGETPKLVEIFSSFEHRLFAGHTHLPLVIDDGYECISPSSRGNRFQCDPGRKYIINVGSVGQPRDKDNRSCYVVVEGETVHWRRVAYDFMRTVKRINQSEGLHDSLGSRLIVGQ